jgi:uncharacterized membrane protein
MKNEVEKNYPSRQGEIVKMCSTSPEETEPEQVDEATFASPHKDEAKEAVTLSTPQKTDQSDSTSQVAESPPADRARVRVSPSLLHMISGLSTTTEEQRIAQEQRDLNKIIHRMLIIGLALSTALMLFGLGLDLTLGREVPTVVPAFMETFSRVAALRPSGFLTLGMLVLIATPILQVVGSIVALLYKRDWRYAGATLVVLAVIMISLISGKG